MEMTANVQILIETRLDGSLKMARASQISQWGTVWQEYETCLDEDAVKAMFNSSEKKQIKEGQVSITGEKAVILSCYFIR